MLGKIAQYIQHNSRQIVSHINARELGYILPNGNINFLDEKIALKYAKNKIVQHLRKEGTEYGVLVKGRYILGEAGGAKNSVNIGEMENLTKRFFNNSNLKRDVILLHGHPDIYAAGKTAPLSPYGGDLELAVAANLKSIIAYNSCGEFNRIDFLKNFSTNGLKKLENEFEELFIKKVTSPKNYKKLKELKNFENTENNIPSHLQKWLEQFLKKQEIKNKKFLESEEYAKFIHEFYQKYLHKCGLKYTTNFNNLC